MPIMINGAARTNSEPIPPALVSGEIRNVSMPSTGGAPITAKITPMVMMVKNTASTGEP